MKKILSLSLALAFGGAGLQTLSTPARAAETATQKSGRAAIVSVYQKQGQAMIKRDVAAMSSYLAPDFLGYTSRGATMNRAGAIAATQQAFGGSVAGSELNYTKYTPRFLSFMWRGKDAIVMVEETSVGTVKRAGRALRVEQVSLSRDYWTPTAQGWKIRQSAEREAKMWIDGKRVE